MAQYDSILHQYDFNEQYNYSLLLNCLLGIIIMPKEQFLSHIPNQRITSKLKKEMGLSDSSLIMIMERLQSLSLMNY
ncbi:MAG: hypothetical protein KDC81_01500 [Flavobacteriaceae bacterium]|nr:hypothetical protein [Flavobacteriaceae bacterium]